ncbi:MAG TPA: preprotein translocase subunit SecG [Firmicutes bacterium]|jgi:preprotein translocase subunit SecG|nr:preprotein translocase subunit SecG [Bacillota bacterium]HBK68458.1 preprotein translocase subunit SecG [Bacillota bacterium]
MNFFSILLLIVSLVLIVIIMIQPSKGEGLGSIGGGSQMFFGKNKGLEVLLEKVTAGLAVAFFLLAIIANLV